MQRFLSIAMVLCLALTFSFEAHAKRFGGGKSFGGKPGGFKSGPKPGFGGKRPGFVKREG